VYENRSQNYDPEIHDEYLIHDTVAHPRIARILATPICHPSHQKRLTLPSVLTSRNTDCFQIFLPSFLKTLVYIWFDTTW